MTLTLSTIDSLNRHLDQVPNDHTARLCLADAIPDGVGNGDGYEALARMGVYPEYWCSPNYRPRYWVTLFFNEHARIPELWFKCIRHGIRGDNDESSSEVNWNGGWAGAVTRRELEDALNEAFQELPIELREKYLRGERD